MPLSNELIREFVKVTSDKPTASKESTTYGTIVDYNGSKWVRLDGSELLTPFAQTTNVVDGERVTVTIKNHTATVTGNLSSPSARRADVSLLGDDLGSQITEVEILMADKAGITYLEAHYATIESLSATNATILSLDTKYATIENLNATNATIDNLDTKYATVDDLKVVHAMIDSLVAPEANIGTLTAEVAKIKSLMFGSSTGETIHTNFSNTVIAQVGDAQIKSAMIESISAAKITAGDIITNNVRVLSEDGKLLISDETIQISDGNWTRVQIGKDAASDYSINIWDNSGKLMFSKGGITEYAVKSAIIRNDMVSSNANISASKLNIDSLFEVINGSSNTIKSTKIYLDDKAQSLDVAFDTLATTVSSYGETISSQGTRISTIQGQISSKIWQQDIKSATDELNNDISTFDTKYSALNQTVNNLYSTVSSHTSLINQKADGSTVTTLNTKVTSLEQNVNGFKSTVSSTYVTRNEFSNLEIGGRNLLTSTDTDGNPVRCKDAGISLSQVTNWTNKDGVLTIECSSSDREIYYRFCNPDASKLYCFERGKTYTLSGKAKITTTSGTFTAFRTRSQNYVVSSWQDNTQADIAFEDTPDWVYFKMSHTITEDSTGCYFSVQVWFDGSWTGKIQLTELQLEEGTVATAYRPAPDDMVTQYNTLSTRITQTAADLSVAIENASKTASNYLNFSGSGLVVGDMTASTLGNNVLIDSDSIDIRSGSTVLASFGATKIELGKNSASSVLSLCGGVGTITASNATINNGAFNALTINSTNIYHACTRLLSKSVYNSGTNAELSGALQIIPYAMSDGVSHMDISMHAEGHSGHVGHVSVHAMDNGDSRVYMYSSPNNESGIGSSIELLNKTMTLTATDGVTVNAATVFKHNITTSSIVNNGTAQFKNGMEIYHATPHIDFHFGNSAVDYTSRIIEEHSGTLTVTGGLAVGGVLELRSSVQLRNGNKIRAAESSGTLRDIMYIDTSNNLIIGNGVSGNTNIYSGSGAVQLYTSKDRVLLRNATDTTYTAHFIPGTNGTATLGTVSNRWHSIYAASSTIGTSDVREKENIFALNDIHSKLFDKLQPVQFNFINTPSRICYGLIAQEVAEAMDELGIGENELDLVHHDYWVDEETNESKDSYGLAYNNLIAMLIHEVQKLKKEVAALKTA